jgi:hypothetical protein
MMNPSKWLADNLADVLVALAQAGAKLLEESDGPVNVEE